MVGFFGIFPIIAEALKLANTLNDPEKRKEMYNLLVEKRAARALDAGQHFILAYDSYKAGTIDERAWKYLYKKYKKIFFAND